MYAAFEKVWLLATVSFTFLMKGRLSLTTGAT